MLANEVKGQGHKGQGFHFYTIIKLLAILDSRSRVNVKVKISIFDDKWELCKWGIFIQRYWKDPFSLNNIFIRIKRDKYSQTWLIQMWLIRIYSNPNKT